MPQNMHEISSKYKRKKSESESFFLDTKTVPNTIGSVPILFGTTFALQMDGDFQT